jgi:hypothetical protein
VGAAEPFEFSGWQRVVQMKYSDIPLSSHGSVNAIGGRFNVGSFDPEQFEPFPALYIAADKETAIQERLGEAEGAAEMDLLHRALQDKNPMSIFSLRGNISLTLDLTRHEALQPFVEQIRNFNLPAAMRSWAQRLQVYAPELEPVTNTERLIKVLLAVRWRAEPNMLGVPATSQIFGRLVRAAGIQAIRYPSAKSGKSCLSIFPHNFEGSDGFVELEGELSPEQEKRLVKRLDATTWRALC